MSVVSSLNTYLIDLTEHDAIYKLFLRYLTFRELIGTDVHRTFDIYRKQEIAANNKVSVTKRKTKKFVAQEDAGAHLASPQTSEKRRTADKPSFRQMK